MSHSSKIAIFFQKTVIIAIRFYQVVSPFLQRVVLTMFGVVSVCPQHPTCSQYTITAIRRHGTMAGLRKGFYRVWNCRKFSKHTH